MGDENPMALNRESFQKAISTLVVITPIALSFLATRVPLEDYLSEIGFRSFFKWYEPWRGAVVGLLSWIVAGIMYNSSKKLTKYLLWGSYIAFALFHYLTLYTVLMDGFKISLFPFFYSLNYSSNDVGGVTYYLDLGQLLLLINLLVSIRNRGRREGHL